VVGLRDWPRSRLIVARPFSAVGPLALCYLGELGATVEETVTLYLGLKKGEKADFEVVGLAAAAFAEAVKEIAFILEPGLDVRLEFDSGTEGSLRLKAVLKSLKTKDSRRAALISIVGTIGLTLITDARGYGFGKLLDHFLAAEQRNELSEEDVGRIAKAVVDINKGKIAKAPVRQLYKQLERDKNIESVGAVTKPDDKPSQPVPRSSFAEKAGIAVPRFKAGDTGHGRDRHERRVWGVAFGCRSAARLLKWCAFIRRSKPAIYLRNHQKPRRAQRRPASPKSHRPSRPK
jgi:hypothetical protein